MKGADDKVEFGSSEWVARARAFLTDLAAALGEPGRCFSVCEVFTGAPVDLAPAGVIAWHFYIDGSEVRVGFGEVEDTDVKITADYRNTLPAAREIYTPEILAERASRPATAEREVRGDLSRAPAYLVELHNRLAVITA
jgi:hypothetical protein